MSNVTINRLFNFASTPPTRSLVAAWNLSDLLDAFGNNDLTNNNGATFVAGKIGNAVNLDGVNQFLSIADNVDLSMGAGVNCTFVGWFNLDTLPAASPIIAKYSGVPNNEYAFEVLANGAVIFAASPDGTAQTTLTSAAGIVSASVWYFFAMWYDGVKLYLELNNTGTIYSTAFTADIFAGPSAFRIGSEEAAGTFADGKIDAVRVYKRVLTAAERSALYNNGVGREFTANTIVASDEVNRELNQLINLVNGITKDVTFNLIGDDAINSILTINQNGIGPIAQFYSSTVLKCEILGNGQFKSYVPVGTAPILFINTPTALLVENLNVDLLDGLEATDFLLSGAYWIQYTSVFFDGTPVVGDRLFFPTMETGIASLEGFFFQQRNGSASATASTSIAIKKDNDVETLVGTVALNNSNSVDTIPISITLTPSDTDRMIAEVSSISGAVKHSDITIIARYRMFPFT